jgi:hypothetical protein
LRGADADAAAAAAAARFPLDALEPAFAELSGAMAGLEANFLHLQLMHMSLARFSENFASFLYGLNMNAFCVDFPEVGTSIPLHCFISLFLRIFCECPSIALHLFFSPPFYS